MVEPFAARLPIEEIKRIAAQLPKLSGDLLVSVDHDQYYPASNPRFPREGDTFECERSHTSLSWRLEEWFSAERSERAWAEYAERLQVLGLDPREYALPEDTMRTRHHKLGQLHPPVGETYVADSHLWGAIIAYKMFLDCGRPISVVHFDAHHDCGYVNYRGDNRDLAYQRAQQAPSCDDWILSGLHHGWINTVQIVYPDWLGSAEWQVHPPAIPPHLQPRVGVMVWSDYAQAKIAMPATRLYVRSSVMHPNWTNYDAAFIEQVGTHYFNLDQHFGCVGDQDCMQERPGLIAYERGS